MILVLFPQYGCFFPITFPSYGTLHHLENAWASRSISHTTRKCNKTHHMGRTWEIGTHTFPIVWVVFSHQIRIVWYTSWYGKCMGFPISFPQYRKMQQNPSSRENLGNWYSYFSHSIDAVFPLDSHFMVYFITWEVHVFSHQFPITRENTAKPSNGESLGNWFPVIFYKAHCMQRTCVIGSHTFPKVWVIFSIRFPSYGTLHHLGNAWVSPSTSQTTGKCNKTHGMRKD